MIEPDKGGELGTGYLKFYKLTGEPRYRDAAIAIANTLARNVRPGERIGVALAFPGIRGKRMGPRTVRQRHGGHRASARRTHSHEPWRCGVVQEGAADGLGLAHEVPHDKQCMGAVFRGTFPSPAISRT